MCGRRPHGRRIDLCEYIPLSSQTSRLLAFGSLQRNQGKTEIFVLQKNKKTKKNVLKTTRRFLFSSRNSLMVSLPRVPDVGCDTSPHVRALCAPELMPLAVHRGRPPPKARPKRAYSAKGSGIGIGDLGSHVRLRKAGSGVLQCHGEDGREERGQWAAIDLVFCLCRVDRIP